MLFFKSLAISAAVLVTFFGAAVGDFDIADLPESFGVFAFIRGSAKCPNSISFIGNDLSIDAYDIKVNNETCSGDKPIILAENPSSGGTELAEALRENEKRGKTVEGVITGVIECGENLNFTGGNVQIFEPNEDFTLNLPGILGNNTPITQTSNGTFLFKHNVDYLILEKECIYSRGGGGMVACFPASATVELASGAKSEMQSLKIGDSVKVGSGEFSEIYMFSHKLPSGIFHFIEITSASGHTLRVTPGHYLYANGALVPASTVSTGDRLRLGDESESPVVSVATVGDEGIFAPQTLHGDILVNGVVASTYTTFVPPKLAHSLLAPVRILYKWTGIYNTFLEMGTPVFGKLRSL